MTEYADELQAQDQERLIDSEEICANCTEPLDQHVTYPALSNYYQCRREIAPWVGATFERQSREEMES